MRASVNLWTRKDPRETATDTTLVLLGHHEITGRVELGTVSKSRGVTFGRSRYWPGKAWDGQWEWTFLPTPREFSPGYDDLLIRIAQDPGRIRS